jgi:hypothetical protein
MGFLSGITNSLFGGTDDSGIKAQQKSNDASQAYIRQQTGQARGDAGQLYQQGDYARNLGINLAMALMGQALPQQYRQLQAGQGDYQNAILGNQDGTIGGTPFSFMQGVQPQASPVQLPDFKQTWNFSNNPQAQGASGQQGGSVNQSQVALIASLLGGGMF